MQHSKRTANGVATTFFIKRRAPYIERDEKIPKISLSLESPIHPLAPVATVIRFEVSERGEKANACDRIAKCVVFVAYCVGKFHAAVNSILSTVSLSMSRQWGARRAWLVQSHNLCSIAVHHVHRQLLYTCPMDARDRDNNFIDAPATWSSIRWTLRFGFPCATRNFYDVGQRFTGKSKNWKFKHRWIDRSRGSWIPVRAI